MVEDGCAYEVENALVTHNDLKYQCTAHRFKLNLIDKTKFTKVEASNIPMNQFNFVGFRNILESDREDKHLDVIGHVVERDTLKVKEVNGKRSKLLDITLEELDLVRHKPLQKKILVPKFKAVVQEGSLYDVEKILVTHNDPKYQTTSHSFKPNLMDITKFIKVDESTIPFNHFDFVSFKDVLGCDREGRCVDIIGHVVEKDALKNKDVNEKRSKLLDITLEDTAGTRIHCSLWDTYAERMDAYLTMCDSTSPVVAAIQVCKLKKYYGVMGISNAFYGTKLILDDDYPHVKEYRKKMTDTDVELTQAVSQVTGSIVVPLADDMLKSKKMTIEDLIESTDDLLPPNEVQIFGHARS